MTKSDSSCSVDTDSTTSFQKLTKSIVNFNCEQDGLEEKVEPFLACIVGAENYFFDLEQVYFECLFEVSFELNLSSSSIPIWISTRRILI